VPRLRPKPKPEQHRALELLARPAGPEAAGAIIDARLTVEQIIELVRAGFADVMAQQR